MNIGATVYPVPDGDSSFYYRSDEFIEQNTSSTDSIFSLPRSLENLNRRAK